MDRAIAFEFETKDVITSNGSQNETALDTPEKILSFGEEATRGISKFADEILSQFSLSYAEDSSKLLDLMNELMGRFDREDFIKNSLSSGIFSKLIHRTKKNVEEIYQKYSAFSKEIDLIFISVKTYELEINDANDMLDRMSEENKQFYLQLENYIHTAESYIEREINPAIAELEEKLTLPDYCYADIELGRYRQIKELI
jgi:uncharacterized protein YaaN involved in tellurite resistance